MLESNPTNVSVSALDLLTPPQGPISAIHGVTRCSTMSSSILGEMHPIIHLLTLSISFLGGNTLSAHCTASSATSYHPVSPHSSTCHYIPQPVSVDRGIPSATTIPSCIVLCLACVTAPVTPRTSSMRCESLLLPHSVNRHAVVYHHVSSCSSVGRCSSLHSPAHHWVLWPRIGSVCIRPHPSI